MRCEEVRELLPVLAYNELDNDSARRCHEHLSGCASCRAEWASIRGTLSLLDQSSSQPTQVDLAAICLRMARQQRHSRVVGRWMIGAAAAAAIVVGMTAAQWFAVNLEPGRLVVAWNATPAEEPLEPAPIKQAADERVGAPHEPHDGGPGAGQATQPADHPRYRAPNLLALLFEGDPTFSRRRLQYAVSMGDGDWGRSFDVPADAAGDAELPDAAAAEPESVTYSDLRRKLMEAQPKIPPRAVPPGA